MKLEKLTERKWFYPLVYGLLLIISMLPPITEIPYDPRDTQDVIVNILMVSINPYQAWGWVFHVATLALVGLAAFRPQNAGRVVAAYFGINYLIIAFVPTMAQTEKYGFALHTGAMVASAILGIVWLVVAWRGKLVASFRDVPAWRYLLLPLALLVFWSPLRVEGTAVSPHLFLLILFYPNVDEFALRVTAFNGLLYGIFNLTHWFNPEAVWLGVLHIPLLVIPLVALLLPVLERGRMTGRDSNPLSAIR
jgi:hypothetical protein